MKKHSHRQRSNERLNLRSLLGLILVLIPTILFAQKQETNLFKRLHQEDTSFIETIVLYSDNQREAVFTASGEPEILVQIDQITEITRNNFKTLIEPYDRSTQEQIWEIARYPDLMDKLTRHGKPSRREIKELTINYPESIQEAALEIATREYQTLYEMNLITNAFQGEFDKIITPYSPEVQNAYRTLLKQPEVLELLSTHLRSTVLIGEAYKQDPQGVIVQAEEMRLIISEQRAKEFATWKEALDNDPKAKADYEAAAKEYAVQRGFNEADLNTPVTNTTVIVYDNFYPYWFGSPYWYPRSYWYPYPWWYDCGFYYGPFGNMVFIGFPSRYFNYWYFYGPYNHYYYPYYTNFCVNQFYQYPYSYTTVNVAVVNWKKDNSGILKEEWLANKDNRVERIKEFGRIEKDREIYNLNYPERKLSKEEYFARNSMEYPRLNAYKETRLDKMTKDENVRNHQPARVGNPEIEQNRQTNPDVRVREPERRKEGEGTIRRENVPTRSVPRRNEPVRVPRTTNPPSPQRPITKPPQRQSPPTKPPVRTTPNKRIPPESPSDDK